MSALRRHAPSSPATYEARIANADPDALTVLIDAFDDGLHHRHEWEVAGWPRSPDTTPTRGDLCLVTFSDTGRAWVLVGNWTGAAP